MRRSLTTIEKIVIGCGVGVFASIAAVALQLWGLLGHAEMKSFDWRVRNLAVPGTATDSIVLIVVDRRSLDWAAAEQGAVWPWPGELFARMIDYCREAGARVVALDTLFDGPSAPGSADEHALRESLERFGRGAVAPRFGPEAGGLSGFPEFLRYDAAGVGEMPGWLAQHPAAEPPLTRTGMFSPDPDGAIRRIRLLGRHGDHIVPQLGLAAYLADHPEATLAISAGSVQAGAISVPVDELGLAVLRFRGPAGTYTTFAAADILQAEQALRSGGPGALPASALRNAYVFIASGVPPAGAPETVAGGWKYLPVEIQATLLDNLLSRDFLYRAAPLRIIIIMFFFCCLCGAAVLLVKTTRASLAISAMIGCIPVLGAIRSYHNGLWLPLVIIEISVVLAIAGSLCFRYAFVESRRRYIRRAFSDVVSPGVSVQLRKNPDRLVLQGTQQTVTAFIAGLNGFETVKNTLEPDRLSAFLNEYLSAVTDGILSHDGTIDRYDGATVIAFWNAPLETGDHALRAAHAAIECEKKLWHARTFFRETCGLENATRIGIHTGPAVVGNMGSRFRFTYTMISGAAAPRARALQELNSLFGTYAIMSSATRALIGEALPVRELGRIVLEPAEEPEAVYEPVAPRRHVIKKELYADYAEGLALFYAGEFAKARTIFARLAEQDQVSGLYARRCAALAQNPPGRWNGALELPA